MASSIKKVLIANRGEIAIRILRTCRELGITTVALFSDADRSALHVRRADEAYYLGKSPATESYLNIEKIIAIAKKARVDAIHPGYGFLSENAQFAQTVIDAGMIFVGPSPKTISQMGSKIEARKIAIQAGVPVIPGMEKAIQDLSEAKKIAQQMGYPILLKAAMGGGGKGMRTVHREEELASAFELASGEALKSFKDGSVFIEKLIEGPHHIEVQILGDQHGNVIHLFERECSIQRRHQKIIEESPSPFITEATRKKVCDIALKLAKHVGYQNAGTIEMLVDKNQNCYFLEVNTRLQVEHPITECVTHLDLVKLQLEIAMGKPLPLKQADITQTGAAIECRIYAEDPFNNFRPSPGLVIDQQYPHGPEVRLDNGIYQGFTVPMEYDPILAKLITWGNTRQEAITRMKRALAEYKIIGIKTNLYFHRRALEIADFVKGHYDTHFVDQHLAEILKIDPQEKEIALMLAALTQHLHNKSLKPTTSGTEAASVSAWKLLGRKAGLRSS
ncbi:MAG: acetyl-CoA carboxylase biotin carboxylase subunit [Deltaproteobacteria bacterium]|nr:acetyl-CoA carboxylase biotin carboxylase subunit [Deltaproteobacteria bacterium]